MDFFETLMFPFQWLVSVIMGGFHEGLSRLGLPGASGWTWTLSIIGLVLVIRAALIPVFVKQIKAQRGMQLLQPDLKKLQDKYKGKTDQLSRQAMAQEQMAMYKKHGTNPFSACLPMLIQMPFFFALFQVLSGISSNAVAGKGIGAMSQEQVRSGHGQPVHAPAENDAVHPADCVRRGRHQLPHRCPDLLDHQQLVDH